jgi:hypothetical protein
MALRRPDTVFLIEHYRPGHGVRQLRRCVRRIEVHLKETAGTSLLCSVVVPIDEAFLLVVVAESEQVVQTAYTGAGTTFDRISMAVTDLAIPQATGPTPGPAAPGGSGLVAATTPTTAAPRTEPERNHLMRITKTALVTFAALLAISAVATSVAIAATGRDHARTSAAPKGQQQLNGTWTTTVQLTDAPPGAPAEFNALDTFLPGGNLLVSSSAPSAALRTLAHGAWIRTGDHRFSSTFMWFRFDPTGQYIGTQRVSRTMVLAKNGGTFQASDTVQVVAPTGAVAATIHGTESGTLLRG